MASITLMDSLCINVISNVQVSIACGKTDATVAKEFDLNLQTIQWIHGVLDQEPDATPDSILNLYHVLAPLEHNHHFAEA